MTPTTTSFADLLRSAVTDPGIISSAYQQFHRYSLGNQLLAADLLRSRLSELRHARLRQCAATVVEAQDQLRPVAVTMAVSHLAPGQP